MIGFREVFRGFGGPRGVKEGLLDSYMALFAPLKVLHRTRFGFKLHMMV